MPDRNRKAFFAVADERLIIDGLGCLMKPVFRQELRQIPAGEACADPDPKVVVHGKMKRLVQAADRFEDVAPEEGRGLADEIEPGEYLKIELFGPIPADDPACGVAVV